MILSVWTKKQAYLDLPSRLLGEHQAANISLALAVVEKLIRRMELTKVKKALEGIRWPGRFEVKKIRGKRVIFDICHTPGSAKALRKTLDQVFPGEKLIFLMAFMKDKNWREVIENLVKPGDELMLTELDMERGLRVEEMKTKVGDLEIKPKFIKNLKRAFKVALSDKRLLVVCGSHFLPQTID